MVVWAATWVWLAPMPGRPATQLPTITADDSRPGSRSGAAVDGGVLAAVLYELVDQEGILPEVKVNVAGQQVGRHETLVADEVPLGVLHLVGRFEAAIVPGDATPVELVPAVELATR